MNMQESLETDVALRLRAIMAEFDVVGHRAMSELCGASTSSVNNWLHGYNLPRVPEMIQLSVNTGITLDWIYRGTVAVMDAKLAIRLARRVDALS